MSSQIWIVFSKICCWNIRGYRWSTLLFFCLLCKRVIENDPIAVPLARQEHSCTSKSSSDIVSLAMTRTRSAILLPAVVTLTYLINKCTRKPPFWGGQTWRHFFDALDRRRQCHHWYFCQLSIEWHPCRWPDLTWHPLAQMIADLQQMILRFLCCWSRQPWPLLSSQPFLTLFSASCSDVILKAIVKNYPHVSSRKLRLLKWLFLLFYVRNV